jgi:hypothetical protein
LYGNEDILNKKNDWENYFDNINHLILKPNDTFPFHIKDLVDNRPGRRIKGGGLPPG